MPKHHIRLVIVTLFLLPFLFLTATAWGAGSGFVRGKILTSSGVPFSTGLVRIYDSAGGSPFLHENWRVPYRVSEVTADGSFSMRLPEGTYYVTALQKSFMTIAAHPPEEGDQVFPPWEEGHKPVEVKEGKPIDIGTVTAVPFRREWAARGKTGIEGTVLDVMGKPVEEVLVIASKGSSTRSRFAADSLTGKDGKYVLRVAESGQYTVKAWGPSSIVASADVASGAFARSDLRPPPLPGTGTRNGDAKGVCPPEDFDRLIGGSTGCLVMKKYGYAGPSPPGAMLVWLHGDLTRGGPAQYHFRLAEKAAAVFAEDKVMSVALVRPGFPDEEGYYSSGNSYRRVDTYTAENISEIGTAIERLKSRYKPGKVIIIGDSGGSAMAAVLLGMKPGLAEGAVLVSCPCELVSWRAGTVPWNRSENPINWAGKISTSAKVIALTGSADIITSPALAASFVEALQARGVDASFQVVQGASHGRVMESKEVTDAIARLITDDRRLHENGCF